MSCKNILYLVTGLLSYQLFKHLLPRVYLHEEAGAERPADVDVIISTGELCAPAGQIEAVHDPGQLLPHVVSRHQ